MTTKDIAETASTVNIFKSAFIEVVEKLAAVAQRGQELENVQELKLVEMNVDYAKAKMEARTALESQELKLRERMFDQTHEQICKMGAGITHIILDHQEKIAEIIKRLPLESIPLGEMFPSRTKTAMEIKLQEMENKFERKLETLERLTQGTKDKLTVMAENGHDKKRGFGSDA